ncbi:MAG: GNAT family N-acetyltransferase [Anaerolineae bacterium]|nr:GNAT family N-acetyltransferase [Anaerolineae bacterium]MCB0180923.1 GNAT family N-acetyltransferase [Anaerolineae bacterium]MCB0224258.1 GNAT family N-acetyltransferase [Anaerolineae bacterium]MCB9104459.1 GNAT family N-acetyltransferase [Anaerolineales bacterium]
MSNKTKIIQPVIREATLSDAQEISELIRSVAHYFTIDPAGVGAERFLQTITPEAIAGYIENDDIFYLAVVAGESIVGVGAVKNASHLFHLFVCEAYQGQQIARRMWNQLAPRLTGRPVTVNSTLAAVPVYEKFGFKIAGSKVERDGIAFVPMNK